MLYGVGYVGEKNQQKMLYNKLLNDLKTFNSKSIIIAIDGVAGSGKTTLAARLATDLIECEIVHMDDLYAGWNNPFSDDLNYRIIKQIFIPFCKMIEISYQKYNWESKTFDSTVLLKRKKYLIIEGVGAAQRAFHKYINKIIWIEFDADLGFERVLKRDGEILRDQMTNFLIDQAKLFESEVPNIYADYIFEGAP